MTKTEQMEAALKAFAIGLEAASPIQFPTGEPAAADAVDEPEGSFVILMSLTLRDAILKQIQEVLEQDA